MKEAAFRQTALISSSDSKEQIKTIFFFNLSILNLRQFSLNTSCLPLSQQDSVDFFMSEESVNNGGDGEARRKDTASLRPNYKRAAAKAHEDHGAILIKIKRRDENGDYC